MVRRKPDRIVSYTEIEEDFGEAEQTERVAQVAATLTEQDRERRRRREARKWVRAFSRAINPRERAPEGTFTERIFPLNNVKFWQLDHWPHNVCLKCGAFGHSLQQCLKPDDMRLLPIEGSGMLHVHLPAIVGSLFYMLIERASGFDVPNPNNARSATGHNAI